MLKIKPIFDPILIPIWLILGPKINQNGTPNGSKFNTIFKMEKVALQEPLGGVLGRSWANLGAILGAQNSSSLRKRNVSSKLIFLIKISFQDAFWTELGRSWPPKGPKMTPTWRPKTAQNRSKIESKKWSKFWSISRGRLCAQGGGPADCVGLLGGI